MRIIAVRGFRAYFDDTVNNNSSMITGAIARTVRGKDRYKVKDSFRPVKLCDYAPTKSPPPHPHASATGGSPSCYPSPLFLSVDHTVLTMLFTLVPSVRSPSLLFPAAPTEGYIDCNPARGSACAVDSCSVEPLWNRLYARRPAEFRSLCALRGQPSTT